MTPNLTSYVYCRSGRHGLFTSYPPLAIGDNSVYQQKKRKFKLLPNLDFIIIIQ